MSANHEEAAVGLARRVLAFLSVCALICMVVSPPSASAAVTRKPTGVTIGPAGTGAGAFESVRSIAVDPASGSIYILDAAAGGSLYKFNSAGKPSNFSALATNVIKGVTGSGSGESQIAVAPENAVGATAGDIYVAAYGSGVKVYRATGTELAAFGQSEACGIAVKSTGKLIVSYYAGTAGGNLVEYTPSKNPPTEADISATSVAGPASTCNIAAAPSGAVYALNYFQTQVTRLTSLSDSTPTLITPGGASLAVDQLTGFLYLDKGNRLSVYDAAGSPDGEIEPPGLAASTAVAVAPNSKTAYVSNGSTGRVEIFGAPLTTPGLSVSAPSPVTENSAVLHGTVNPENVSTASCLFEYTTQIKFEAEAFQNAKTASCIPSGPFSGATAQAVEASIDGLDRVTEYVYRLTSTNVNGTNREAGVFATLASPFTSETPLGPCPANEALRTGPGAYLPDCRAYEQVSPVDKNGGGVEGLGALFGAAPDGSAVTYFSQAGTQVPASGGAAQTFPTYLSRRIGEEWNSQRLLPNQADGEAAEYLGSSRNLDYALVESGNADEGTALFEIDTAGGTPPVQLTNHIPSNGIQSFALDGINADGSIVYFETKGPVAVGPSSVAPAPNSDNLYVWNRASGEVTVAGVLPGATPTVPGEGSFAGGYDWYSAESTSVGGALASMTVASLNAISSDGSQVYFTSAGDGQLYLRRGIGGPQPASIQVSKPEAGVADPFAPQPAAFMESTPDGEQVFFTSAAKLTTNATTGPDDEGSDLYRWNARTGTLTDIAPDLVDEDGARVRGLVGVSEDGKSGYFIARGVLDTGGKAGEENLYRFAEDGATHKIAITYIATLNKNGEQGVDRRAVSPLALLYYPVSKTSRVTPDGEVLLFESTASLTGYNNVGRKGALDCNSGQCGELYRYSALEKSLECISCDATGARPRGAASLQSTFIEAFLTPSAEPEGSLTRNLSENGDQIFFQTPDQLVPRDTNGTVSCRGYNEVNETGPAYCQDVYEWETPGSGSCHTSEVNGGCLYLLSTGNSNRASYFVGASTDGATAFIVTNSPLIETRDKDSLNDLYAVTVNGGLAAQNTLPPTPCGDEPGCRSPSATEEPEGKAGTAIFSGPGNQNTKSRCKHSRTQCHRKKRKHGKKRNRKPHKTRRPRHQRGKVEKAQRFRDESAKRAFESIQGGLR